MNKRPRIASGAPPPSAALDPSRVRDAALRDLLAWDVCRGDEAPQGAPTFASGEAYVDAWVGAWLRETRAEVAQEARNRAAIRSGSTRRRGGDARRSRRAQREGRGTATGCDVDIPRRRVAAPPRGATWIFC